MAGDARFWEATLWPENMIPDWQNKISDLLQIPFVYCIHDKDNLQKCDLVDDEYHEKADPRKTHVHLMIVFSNTTTYNNAFRTFQKLFAPGKKACNLCRRVQSVRFFYEYLIHNTQDAKKKNKHIYDTSERIEGNLFDIGAYEQINQEDRERMRRELARLILDNNLRSYHRFYLAVLSMKDDSYEDVAAKYQGFFRSLTSSIWQEWKESVEDQKRAAEKNRPCLNSIPNETDTVIKDSED